MFFLEHLCLDFIVQNFERFYFAYAVSKDDNLQRNFEFLQRRFSTEVLRKLYVTNKLRDVFLELLLNEHLDYIEDVWLCNSRYWYSMPDIFLHLPNLKKIYLFNCNDKILKNLANFCPKIVEILMLGCNVTDKGVEYLCKDKYGMVPCPELKNLFIKETNVTDSGAECLIRSISFEPSLERLDYENVPLLIHSIHEENLHKFKTVRCYDLVELSFLRSESLSKSKSLLSRTEILKTCLTVCPKLKSLSCYISDKEQLDLITNTRIHWKKLHLEFSTTNPKLNIDYFLKLKGYSLTSLSITDCTMSISALGLQYPILKKFSAERVSFSDIDSDDNLKVAFSSLSNCEFKDIELSSNKGISLLLSSSPKLVCVKLHKCMLSLELKSRILLWGKTPCAELIDLGGIDIASEMKFLEDILLNSPSLVLMWIYDEYLYEYELEKLGISERLRNLANSVPNKPEIRIVGKIFRQNS